MHGLVKEYRETRKILLNIEHRLMLAMTPDYEQLPLIGKVLVCVCGLFVCVCLCVCVCVCVCVCNTEWCSSDTRIHTQARECARAHTHTHTHTHTQVEVFEHALGNTTGQDLNKVLMCC
jgi:hypothetical protein